MIRLAFIGVLAIAGLLAFAGYSLVRHTGGTPVTAQIAPQDLPDAPPEPEPDTATPVYFLADQDLDTGGLVLVLNQAGDNGVVVTAPAALKAAQNAAFVTVDAGEEAIIGSTDLGLLDVPADKRIAALYRDDTLVLDVRCRPETCGPDAMDGAVDYADLLAAARPLEQVAEAYDTYEGYLDALTFIAAEPDYALLGLMAPGDVPHPVPQTTPEAVIALPFISRSAAQPLDVSTHTALLSALIEGILPQGVTLTNLAIMQQGSPIVVDADNGLAATRGGAEIPFSDVLFYAPEISISGASDLPDDVMNALTNDTLLRVDWDDAADDFLRGLGLTCSDCYLLRQKGEAYDEATVISRVAERYSITFYDLRDTP